MRARAASWSFVAHIERVVASSCVAPRARKNSTASDSKDGRLSKMDALESIKSFCDKKEASFAATILLSHVVHSFS